MAQVFRARDQATGERVAVKLLDRDSGSTQRRFDQEVQVLSELAHPHIVRYVAHGLTDDGRRYLVMEWLEGEPVDERLKRERLSVAQSVLLVRGAAQALGKAHAAGIVHRDVKPSNLFLVNGEIEQIRVLDFGIARLVDTTQALTNTGFLLGTPMYMAPEQVKAERDIDARVDVFALGCLLFECLRGRRAFQGPSVTAVLAKILFEDTPRLSDSNPDIPPLLDEMVRRMMSRNREHRPTDGAAVAEQLSAFGDLEQGPIGATPSSDTGISASEQRVVCVILVGRAPTAPSAEDLDDLPTVTGGIARPLTLPPAMRVAAAQHLELETMADGRSVCLLSGATPGELAIRAARSALAFADELSEFPIVLCTGFGVVSHARATGHAIDRAAEMLDSASAGVVVDAMTAGLLDGRFEVQRRTTDHGPQLMLLGAIRQSVAITPFHHSFVGRNAERAILDALLEAALDEPAAKAALVLGAPGVGKSRLAEMFVNRAREENVEVWTARGDPLTTRHRFGVLGPALRRAAKADRAPSSTQCEQLTQWVAEHTDAEHHDMQLSAFLGEMAGVPFDELDNLPLQAARADPSVMAQQIRWAWTTLLRTACSVRPMLIVIEDLHWADLPSVKLIGTALEQLDDVPLMVLALARPEAKQRFAALWPAASATEIRLAGLGKRDARRLTEELLGVEAKAPLVDDLIQRAAGNPFVLEELCQAQREGRGDSLPETVLGMVQSRLDALGGDGKHVLRAASVFGHTFSDEGVGAVIGTRLSPSKVAGCLDELTYRELIVRDDITTEFAFRHALVRDAAYAMLTEKDRTLGHRLAAEWLETKQEAPSATTDRLQVPAILLAQHYERGQCPDRASDWYMSAADDAIRGEDHVAAFERTERGLDCLDQSELSNDTLRGALLRIRARAHGYRGELEEALQVAEAALELLERGSALWFRTMGSLVRAAGQIGKSDSTHALALCDTEPADDTARTAQLEELCWTVPVPIYLGEREISERLLLRAEAIAHDTPELPPLSAARLGYARGYFASDVGSLDAAASAYRTCVDAYRLIGSRYGECLILASLGFIEFSLGQYDEAIRVLTRAGELADEIGSRYLSGVALLNIAMTEERRENFEQARQAARRAFDRFERLGHAELRGHARFTLASIAQATRRHDEAIVAAREAVEELAEFRTTLALALATLARIELEQDDTASALSHAKRGLGLLDEIHALESGEGELRLVYAQALAASGSSARDAVQLAHERLLARAAQIDDPALRVTFLTHVRENRDTVTLAQCVLG